MSVRRCLISAALAATLAAVTSAVPAATASTLALDGVDDYVQAGLDPTAAESDTARTWEAWVKTDSAADQAVIGRYRHATGEAPWHLSVQGGRVYLGLHNGTVWSTRRSATRVDDGEWHHVAGVWVPGGRLDVYVDGQLDNGALDGPIPAEIDTAADVDVRIGVLHFQGARWGFFDGGIDEVRYSAGARYGGSSFTPACELTGDTDTIGLWRFEEGSGTSTATAGAMTGAASLEAGAGFAVGTACGCDEGSGLTFDGADDYLEVGLDPKALFTTSPRTWEAWVKTTATGYRTIIGRYRNEVGRQPFAMALEDGRPVMSIQQGASAWTVRRGSVTVNDGEWHHVAFVWEPGVRLDAYVDGRTRNGSIDGAVLSSIDVADDLGIRIGVLHYRHSGLYGFFDGTLDEVRYTFGARYDAPFTPQPELISDAPTIGLWRFEEGSGTTTTPTGYMSTPADLVNGPTWSGGAGCWEPQEPGDFGVAFDGVDDYVEAGPDPTESQTSTARTWETWVKTTATGYQTLASRYRHSTGYAPWYLVMDAGFPRIGVQLGGAYGQRTASVAVNDGQWHHVAAVWAPGDRLDLYVDGQLANGALDGSILSTMDHGTGATMRFGVLHYRGALWGHFAGTLDEFRYSTGARYTGAFTPAAHPAADADTIGIWHFDEGAGTLSDPEGASLVPAELLNGAAWTAGR